LFYTFFITFFYNHGENSQRKENSSVCAKTLPEERMGEEVCIYYTIYEKKLDRQTERQIDRQIRRSNEQIT